MGSKVYKERRLYYGDSCSQCGHKFISFKRSKIKKGLCRKCRKNPVDPGQTRIV